MQVIYSYLVKNSFGMELEDEIHRQTQHKDESTAIATLEQGGYIKVDSKNYEKQLNDTLYELATLIK